MTTFIFLCTLLGVSDPAEKITPAWVRDQVQAIQPRPEEKKIDEIAWADGILPALGLAREHNRPVFLFTLDGRIDTGRC